MQTLETMTRMTMVSWMSADTPAQKFAETVAILLVDADDVPGDMTDLVVAADACSEVDARGRAAAHALAAIYQEFATKAAPHLRVLEAVLRKMPDGQAALEIVDEGRAFPAREKN